jgi:hypothetical protein
MFCNLSQAEQEQKELYERLERLSCEMADAFVKQEEEKKRKKVDKSIALCNIININGIKYPVSSIVHDYFVNLLSRSNKMAEIKQSFDVDFAQIKLLVLLLEQAVVKK